MEAATRILTLEEALEASRVNTRRFARLAMLMAGIGLLYMAMSVGVVYHLSQANNETCQSRAETRSVVRQYIALLPDWTYQDQMELDKTLPPIYC